MHSGHRGLFQRAGKVHHVAGSVKTASLRNTTRPGENRRNGVGRRFLALLVLSEVAGDGSVRRLALVGLAVWSHQRRRHEAQRAKSLGHNVGLHVAVVVLQGHDKAALGLDHLRHHVVDQTVLVPQAVLLELLRVLLLVDGLENVLEPPVVLLQNGVLGRQVQRQLLAQRHLERRVGKPFNGLVRVVHGQPDSGRLVVVDGVRNRLAAVLGREHELQLARLRDHQVRGLVLVAMRMSANDNGFFPTGDQTGDPRDDDGLAEHRAAQNVADGAVGRQPHLLQAEFGHTSLVRSDGGTFHADTVLFDGIGRVDGDLVVCFVTGLDAQVVVLQVDVQVRVDQLVLDAGPDDSGHFVAVQFDNWVGDFDFGHGRGRGKEAPRNALAGSQHGKVVGGWYFGGRYLCRYFGYLVRPCRRYRRESAVYAGDITEETKG